MARGSKMKKKKRIPNFKLIYCPVKYFSRCFVFVIGTEAKEWRN